MIKQGELLDFYLPMIKKILRKKPDAYATGKFAKTKLKIISMLGGCEKCFAGQIAFWYYFFTYGIDVQIIAFTSIVIVLTKMATIKFHRLLN